MERSTDIGNVAPDSALLKQPALLKDLSFPSLAEAMARYIKGDKPNQAGGLERWSFAIGLFGAGIGMFLGSLLQGRTGLALAGVLPRNHGRL